MTRVSRKSPDRVAAAARSSARRRAEAALQRMVADDGERTLFAEAVVRYADAVADEARLRCEWVNLGSPVMTSGSMGQQVPHPLVRMIEAASAQAMRFAVAVGLDPSVRVRRGGAGGRPVGSASAPDRVAAHGEPPRLRRVK